MPTPQQIKLIQIARRQVGLEEFAYRILLRNVANVDSRRKLGNQGIEDVMAVLEDMGFRQIDQPGDYWRKKVQARTDGDITSRQMWFIETLAAMTKYPAASIARRMSHDRTDDPRLLYEAEAYEVIEAYKSILKRQSRKGIPNEYDPLYHS